MSAYKTGSKKQVLENLIMCAVRDQIALIEAYKDQYGNILDANAIKECNDWIEDFRRLGETLKKGIR